MTLTPTLHPLRSGCKKKFIYIYFLVLHNPLQSKQIFFITFKLLHYSQPSNNNGVKLNGATESDMSGSSNSSGSKRSFQLGSKSKIEIIMESKVAFVLVCIVVMWLGIGMGKFIMWYNSFFLLLCFFLIDKYTSFYC